jgi:hypothetical protein
LNTAMHDAPRQSENAYVLAGRPLRSGSRLEGTSRFSDDVWRLAPAIVQVQERTVVLNFPTVPARFRPAAKRLFYAPCSARDWKRPLARTAPRSPRSAALSVR